MADRSRIDTPHLYPAPFKPVAPDARQAWQTFSRLKPA
jgi:hypothetical protein